MKEKVFTFIYGARLAFLRESKGLTQKELADLLQISRATVVTWEAKDRFKLKDEQINALVRALGVTPKDLTIELPKNKKEDDILDHPLVKSYVDQINQLNKLVEVLERENAQLRGRK